MRRDDRSIRHLAGPFLGMRDSLDPSSSLRQLAKLLRNCYPLDPQFGLGRVVGRPGFLITDSGNMPLVSSGVGQLLTQFTELDGTEHTVAIVSGRLFEYNWGTDTWSEPVTTANFTTASITLSTTARCYAVIFADTLLVTDGVNTPWTWDGTSGAGGLTKLTNAPVIYGQPRVHYGRVFAIKATERTAIVWSQPNQANTGYEAGGYNNAWTIGQTDTDALYALMSTNELLYVFRARSTTAIMGEVTANYSTFGTVDGISDTEGTVSPGAVFRFGRDVYFLNADGRPHFIRAGSEAAPIWEDYRETINSVDLANLDDAEGWYDPQLRLGCFCVDVIGTGGGRSRVLAYTLRGQPQAAGRFDGWIGDRHGLVKDGSGVPVVMHTLTGNVYAHGTPEGSYWDDNGTAIYHSVEAPTMGYDVSVEKYWDVLDLGINTRTDMTNIVATLTTPEGTLTTPAMNASGSFARFGTAKFGTAVFAGQTQERHLAVGFGLYGRWAYWKLAHDGVGEQFGLETALLQGYDEARIPVAP